MLYNPMTPQNGLEPHTAAFYRRAMQALNEAGVPFLVGGSYALTTHTQMPRRTKDLDLFVEPADVKRVLAAFDRVGYRTEITFSHWLGKAYLGEDFVDIIYNSGNGLCPVDDEWFEHALSGVVLDVPVLLCPLEESIWQKSFIMERHRYDGGDVAHLLRAGGASLDWQRLLRRFGEHWRVLFSHLLLYGFIYPGDEAMIPEWVRQELICRYQQYAGTATANNQVCGGTFLSSIQYRGDIEQEGLKDARLEPHGNMSRHDLSKWLASFDE